MLAFGVLIVLLKVIEVIIIRSNKTMRIFRLKEDLLLKNIQAEILTSP